MPDPVIVAIGAHAADMEFAAGATLCKHVRAGWHAHILNLTLGEKGAPQQGVAAYAAQKRDEALACAEILGVSQHFLDYADGELPVTDEIAARIALHLRRLQPQVILTHWPGSIHQDHTNTHHLTRRAHFMAAIPHFELEDLPPMRACRIYYTDNWEDPEGFEPFVYVDVSDVFEEYERAFKCFAIGRGEGDFPYWDWYQAHTRIHGIHRRTRHCQAFAVAPDERYQVKDLL